MAEERLRGHEGQRRLLADLRLTQCLVDVEDHLVGCAEAAGALGRADDDRPRVLDELEPGFGGVHRVFEAADGVRGALLGAEARDDGEVVLGPRPNQQVVVGDLTLVGEHLVLLGVDMLDGRMPELDAPPVEDRLELHADLPGLAPPGDHPDQRGHEDEAGVSRDDGDLRSTPQLELELEGRVDAGEAATQNDDVVHGALLSRVQGGPRSSTGPQRQRADPYAASP